MAKEDKKISELTAYISPVNTDLFPIVDITNSITKKITLANLRKSVASFITVGFSGADYICDGTADNIQIQAAIDACATAGGGIVFIKAGTYDITAKVTVTSSDIAIIGEGWKTILKIGANFATILETSGTISNLIFRDFCLDGNNKSLDQTLFHLTHASYVLVDNLLCKNASLSTTYNGVGIGTNTLSKSIIRNCTFLNNSHYGLNVSLSSYVRVKGCLAEGNRHHGLAYNTSNYISFVGNIVIGDAINTTDIGISGVAGTSSNILISNNVIYGAFDNYGIVLRANDSVVDSNIITDTSATMVGILIVNGFTDIVVSNNKIEGGKTYGIQSRCQYTTLIGNQISNVAIGTDGYGIIMDSGHQTCIGNNITGCAKGGIYSAADYNTLIGNMLRNNTTDGILFFNTDKNIVQGNVIRGQKNGLRIYTSTYNNITGNEFLDNTSYAVKHEDANSDYNLFVDNVFSGNGAIFTGTLGTNTKVRNNLGYVTENSGTGTINSGATSATITHGLSYTPTRADITITLGEDPTNTPGAIWVDTIGATTFKVNCENDPGASNLDFSWSVRKI